MKKKTEDQYRKMAQAFYSNYLPKDKFEKHLICSVLTHISSKYQPKSFCNLKLAISFDLQQKGYYEIAGAVERVENLAVILGNSPNKSKKIKTVSANQLEKINKAVLGKKNDKQLQYAVAVLKVLGLRPAELITTKRISKNSFLVTSVKKDAAGNKGLDRILTIEDKNMVQAVAHCLRCLENTKIKRIRDRFSYLMKNTFPKKVKVPTLYLYRHILGSNLKASSFTSKQIAYMMGHQSTRTMENYGYRNSGDSGGVLIKPGVTDAEINVLVRDNQLLRDKARMKRLSMQNGPVFS